LDHFPVADDPGLRFGGEWEMGLTASPYTPIVGWSAHAGRTDWRRSVPSTVALMLFLAGCTDPRQPKVVDRQPSLRVADAALAVGAPEVALRVADLTLAREPHSSLALIAKGDALYAMGELQYCKDVVSEIGPFSPVHTGRMKVKRYCADTLMVRTPVLGSGGLWVAVGKGLSEAEFREGTCASTVCQFTVPVEAGSEHDPVAP
jgi:hypothetical protein